MRFWTRTGSPSPANSDFAEQNGNLFKQGQLQRLHGIFTGANFRSAIFGCPAPIACGLRRHGCKQRQRESNQQHHIQQHSVGYGEPTRVDAHIQQHLPQHFAVEVVRAWARRGLYDRVRSHHAGAGLALAPSRHRASTTRPKSPDLDEIEASGNESRDT
jgi:hypothetical protein